MNADAAAALRSACEKMMAGPQAIKEQKKVFGFNYTSVSCKVAEKIARNLDKVDPELIAYWKKFLA